MTAVEFIDQLEKQGLLPDVVIGSLRRMVDDAAAPPSPEEVAKLLIHRGQLTPFQAKKLLEPAHAPRPTAAKPDVPVAKIAPEKPKPKAATPAAPELMPLDDLGLAPLEGEQPALQPLGDELMPLDDAPAAKAPAAKTPAQKPATKPATPTTKPATPAAKSAPATKPAAKQAPAAKPAAPAPAADSGLAPLEGLSPLDEALTPLAPQGPAAGGNSLLNDPLLAQADALAGGSVLLPAKPKTFWESLFSGGGSAAPGAPARPANPWESPLILFGGGGLLLLTIIAVALYFALSQGNVQQAWDAAEKDYHDGAWSQAIEKFDKFAASYSGDKKKASLAKVRSAVAKLRMKTTNQDWPAALTIAKEVLPAAEKEEAFAEARPELTTLLPDILEGLANRAKGTTDAAEGEKLLAEAKLAQELVDNPAYLPTTARQEAEGRIARIKDQVVELDLVFSQDKQLAEAIEKIKAAAEAGKPADAYEERRKLIAKYPQLDRNPDLRAALAAAALKGASEVKTTDGGPLATAPAAAASPGETILVASRTGAPVEGGPGGILPVLAAGSIFGIDVQQGHALWRRPVGTSVLMTPVRLAQGEEDVLFYDANHKSLVRASGKTGAGKWQLATPEEPFSPLIDGTRALVAFRSGELWQVDLASGNVTKQVKFPQPLGAAPALEAGKFLAVAAEHTNLFVLDPETLACRAVTYVGHASGSVGAPPAAVLGHLLLALNTGGDVSFLHSFALAADSGQLTAVGAPLRLVGRVRTPPSINRGRAAFATDREQLIVLEINPADPQKPVNAAGGLPARNRESVLVWTWFDGTQLWVAGRSITRYQVARGQLSKLVEADGGDWIDAPLEKLGDVLLSVRRRDGAPGWAVAATMTSAQANPRIESQHVWEVLLGVPGVGAPEFDATKRAIVHITAAGDLFEIGGPDAQAGRAGPPVVRLPAMRPPVTISTALTLGDGQKVYWGPRRSDTVWQRAEGTAEFKPLTLPVSMAKTKVAPAALGGNLLFALEGGPLVGAPPGGREPTLVYQPPLGADETIAWKSPTPVKAEMSEILASDDRGRLTLLAQADPNGIYLAAKGQAQADGELLGPPAVLGMVAVAAVRKDGKDAAAVFSLPQLTPGSSHALTGRCQFGPVTIGDGIYIATEKSLVCIADSGDVRWKIDLPGPLAGPPAAAGSDLLVACASGHVLRLKAADGSEIGKPLELGEPLRGPPSLVGKRVLVGTPDGSLRFVPFAD